jgi:hypothetical protein
MLCSILFYIAPGHRCILQHVVQQQQTMSHAVALPHAAMAGDFFWTLKIGRGWDPTLNASGLPLSPAEQATVPN